MLDFPLLFETVVHICVNQLLLFDEFNIIWKILDLKTHQSILKSRKQKCFL